MTSARIVEPPRDIVRRRTAEARRRSPRQCPRCSGNLFVSREDYRTVWHCLQCGREFAAAPATTAASRAA